MLKPHVYDHDACCVHCGFDGAEWSHLKQPGERQPLCNQSDSERRGTVPPPEHDDWDDWDDWDALDDPFEETIEVYDDVTVTTPGGLSDA